MLTRDQIQKKYNRMGKLYAIIKRSMDQIDDMNIEIAGVVSDLLRENHELKKQVGGK